MAQPHQSNVSKWVFLPGLDGTGLLFDPILESLPSGIRATVVRYPCQAPANAAYLGKLIEASLPQNEPYVLLAESFSGPIALRALGEIRGAPAALILCSSFGRSPVSNAAGLALRLCAETGLSRLPIPTWLIRRYLLGDAPESVVQSFRRALTQLSHPALASRFKILAEYKADFVPTQLALPILYIQAGQDRLVHKRELDWLKDRFPHMHVVKVDSPHFVLQARPQQALRLILTFLQEQGINH